jgi:hypothetical protein
MAQGSVCVMIMRVVVCRHEIGAVHGDGYVVVVVWRDQRNVNERGSTRQSPVVQENAVDGSKGDAQESAVS